MTQRKILVSALPLILVLISCAKISSSARSQAEQTVLNSSIFHPLSVPSDGGFIPAPTTGPNGGSDGGTIATGSGGTIPPTTTGGTTSTGGTTTPTGSTGTGTTTGTTTPPTNGDGGTVAGGGTTTPPAGGDGGTIGSSGGTLSDVDIYRMCTWHSIPQKFFEQASNPILSLESVNQSSCNLPSLAFMSPVPLLGGSTVIVASQNLKGFPLIQQQYSSLIGIPVSGMKQAFPTDWTTQWVQMQVCDDTNNSKKCSDKQIGNIISVAPTKFPMNAVPSVLSVDAFSGQFAYDHDYYTNLPSFCEKLKSPLVLDLDQDGIALVGPANGVYFDLTGGGDYSRDGWTSSDRDMFLVMDRNHNGVIDNGSEMFGNFSTLSTGVPAANGFVALADLDNNHDGIFDRNDPAWNRVQLWGDSNHDGYSDPQELHSLGEEGLVSINLHYGDVSETDSFGNQTRERSTFLTNHDGLTKPAVVADIWFLSLDRH